MFEIFALEDSACPWLDWVGRYNSTGILMVMAISNLSWIPAFKLSGSLGLLLIVYQGSMAPT